MANPQTRKRGRSAWPGRPHKGLKTIGLDIIAMNDDFDVYP
ncbi:hypothetical protein AB0G29_35195 [Streptomyces parvus]